jgi:DNA-binding response OmpR family regulator
MRILIIESVERNQALIKRVLQPLLLEVDAVYSIEDGRHYIASGIYDIIIYGWTISSSKWPQVHDHTVAIVEREIHSQIPQIPLTDLRTALLDWVESKLAHQATILIGDITLDTRNRRLLGKSGSVTLTPTELQLLLLLAKHDEPVPKQTIEVTLFTDPVASNQVEVYISYLRQKLRQVQTTVRITTIRRVGYLLKTS